MNEASNLIDSLWKEGDSLESLDVRLKADISKYSPAVAGFLAKELLNRAGTLSTAEFATAAFLASDGEAGNDRLLDFIDCVSILPFNRYSRIAADHDVLIDDLVSSEFGEFGFYNLFKERFEQIFGEEGEGLFSYLVFGAEEDRDFVASGGVSSVAAVKFPRLFQRYGHLLDRGSLKDKFARSDKACLDDFIK